MAGHEDVEDSVHVDHDDLSPGKLFVGGLSWTTSEEKLREYFQQFGLVEDVLIMRDNITQVQLYSRKKVVILVEFKFKSITYLNNF